MYLKFLLIIIHEQQLKTNFVTLNILLLNLKMTHLNRRGLPINYNAYNILFESSKIMQFVSYASQ